MNYSEGFRRIWKIFSHLAGFSLSVFIAYRNIFEIDNSIAKGAMTCESGFYFLVLLASIGWIAGYQFMKLIRIMIEWVAKGFISFPSS